MGITEVRYNVPRVKKKGRGEEWKKKKKERRGNLLTDDVINFFRLDVNCTYHILMNLCRRLQRNKMQISDLEDTKTEET